MRTAQHPASWLLVTGTICLSFTQLVRADEPVPYPTAEAATAISSWKDSTSPRVQYTFDDDVTLAGCQGSGCRPNYAGGRYTDWWWGCGGSPFRTGPGQCDNWRVGPVWDVYVDGITMFRDDTNLAALEAAAIADGSLGTAQFSEQFEVAPGARLSLIGDMPRWQGFAVEIAYEGVEEWNAGVLFPKFVFEDDMAGGFNPVPGDIPPPPFPNNLPLDLPPYQNELFLAEQSSLYYRTNLHAVEMNVLPSRRGALMPFGGFRFMRIDDELQHIINQEVSPTLAGAYGIPNSNTDPAMPTDPISSGVVPAALVAVDRLNLFDIDNNLMGGQLGVRCDIWNLGRRFSLQGFASAGLYLNQASQTNIMTTSTTQFIADNIDTNDTFEKQVDAVEATMGTKLERTEIAYMGEASLTAVFRLNRCVAMRGGYQILAIDGIYMADDAFLFSGMTPGSLVLHGWHGGIEYRR